MNKKITVAQIQIQTGDLVGNTDKIINNIFDNSDSDFIVFPEMTISGYNCGDLFEKEVFIHDCNRQLNRIATESEKYPNLVILVGGPRLSERNLYNSAFVIQGGVIVAHYDKQLLANDYHHEDRKYFKAGTQNCVLYLNGIRFGVALCEDLWLGHGRDISRELNAEGVDIIFSMNYSYYTFNKVAQRERLFGSKKGSNIVYVNAVGVGDITKNFICYDGNSFVCDYKGGIQYLHEVGVLNGFFRESICTIEYCQKGREFVQSSNMQGTHDQDLIKNKYYGILQAITYSQGKIFSECGMKKAQVHISGGIDSAIVGYIAVQAMGVGGVVFITQPSSNNGSKTLGNAKYLADALGVELEYDPIIPYMDIYKKENEGCSKAQVASFEATLRKALGFSYTHKNKSGIVACGNHTENVLGFFGFGDIGSMGVYQPIGDLTKTEIFELARFINENIEGREVIPACLYDGSMKPAAELEDNNEDPFDYRIMSIICEKIIREGETPAHIFESMAINWELKDYSKDFIWECIQKAWVLSKRSVFKRAQSAPVLILSNRSIGFSSRETIINHYK